MRNLQYVAFIEQACRAVWVARAIEREPGAAAIELGLMHTQRPTLARSDRLPHRARDIN